MVNTVLNAYNDLFFVKYHLYFDSKIMCGTTDGVVLL